MQGNIGSDKNLRFVIIRFSIQVALIFAVLLCWSCKTAPKEQVPKTPPTAPKSKSAKIIEYNGLYYQEGTTIPFTGRQKSYWPNGRMMQDVSFHRGKKNGKESRSFYNGKPYYEKNYLHGKLHGVKKEWDMQSGLKVSEIWESGRLLEKLK
jgi:hypothetical protein